ncbi:hypothetical protein BH09SUM1_BH09SUM1_32400 [soil metagenome]
MPAGKLSDEEVKHLLRRALTHDEQAWKALFEGLYGLIKSQAMRAGLKDEDVDDTISTVLLSMVATPWEFLAARDSLSYLAASAYFAALRCRRTRGRLAAREISLGEWQVPDDSKPPLKVRAPQRDAALSSQVTRALLEAIEAVPVPLREQVLLHYGEDLSYEEIAYITGNQPANIRVATHRALVRIREHLGAALAESMEDAQIRHALRAIQLPAVTFGDYGEATLKRVNLLVQTPSSLSEGDRTALEEKLASDAGLRHQRVLAERRAAEEQDVRSHSDGDVIPSALLDSLLAEARLRTAVDSSED